MASSRTTVATLTIALIVFDILTFVLAVTTYLFFQRWMEEYEAGVAQGRRRDQEPGTGCGAAGQRQAPGSDRCQ